VFDTDANGQAVFVATDVPSMGYKTFEVTSAPGQPVSTLRESSGLTLGSPKFSVELRSDGTVKSIRDQTVNRELVNNLGELPFNDLLRLEGSDVSKVNYPVPPKISIRKGLQMSEITIARDRSLFPITRITLYNALSRVELHNELDPERMPFVGGNNNWHDSYYFAFPFNIAKGGLKVMRGGQKWFETLPDDYLPGARQDSVSTQHLISMTDGKTTALIAHRQAFHWIYSGFISTKIRPKNEPAAFPAMYSGKFPLPEATLYSRAVRQGSQADTHDLGIINIPSVEPGVKGNMIFDYAFAGGNVFDPVRAWQMGADFNLPLMAQYVPSRPTTLTEKYFSVDQPNVEVVTVKPVEQNTIRGEVSSAPLSPVVNKVFIVRLQEFAGKPANVRVDLPVMIKTASIVNMTEEHDVARVLGVSPLTVAIKPFQTLSIRIETE
jgi:hypothetical protein